MTQRKQHKHKAQETSDCQNKTVTEEDTNADFTPHEASTPLDNDRDAGRPEEQGKTGMEYNTCN